MGAAGLLQSACLTAAVGVGVAAGVPSAWAAPTLKTVFTFNGSNGQGPAAGLTIDAAGNLYGTTEFGGGNSSGGFESGYGTAFELAAGTRSLTTLYTFNASGPAFPLTTLVPGTDGNLYGTTGAAPYSGPFQLSAGSRAYSSRGTFAFNAVGGNPMGNLAIDAAGNVYGTLENGGPHYDGSVYELPAGSSTPILLVAFNGLNGYYPYGGVTLDRAGNLYGTTSAGGTATSPGNGASRGTVFEFNAKTQTIQSLASFNGSDGSQPMSDAVVDAAGNVFGTTQYGGANGDGTLFEILAGSGAVTTLMSFGASDGIPQGGLIIDGAGNLFGATADIVYEVTAGNHAVVTLATFDPDTTGYYSSGDLVADANGNLYGTGQGGGIYNDGTVFEVSNTGFVPEPSTVGFLGLTALSTRRRRRRSVPIA